MNEQIDQFFRLAADLIKDHWMKGVSALAFTLLGWWWGRRRARAQWRKKEFLHRLNVSLTSIRDGRLLIRTVLEKSLEEVLLNKHAVSLVEQAADRTTEQNPMLPLAKDDLWYILNGILNEVAEKFSMGELRRDAGLPVSTHQYLICLTRERAGEMKTQKIRAMLVKKETLLSLPEQTPQLESPNHLTRFLTLQCMAKTYRANPEQFIEIDISL